MDEFKKETSIMDGKGETEWDESEHPRDEEGKFISINEFRYLEDSSNKGFGHPSHLYAKDSNDNVKFHQLTHSSIIKEEGTEKIIKTKRLYDNPNPRDKRIAYFIPKSQDAKMIDFGKQKKNWILSDKNNEILKKYRDKPFNK